MGRVVHFEIPVDDTEHATEFFRQVFGWNIENREGSWGAYLAIQTGEKDKPGIDGAFFRKRLVPPEFARVINTIAVDDIDKHMEMIKDHGGKIVFGKIPYADLGELAYFSDPEGNILGIIELKK